MPGSRNRKDVDEEVDLHGLTAEQLRVELQRCWPRWSGLYSVRIVHGQGTVLRPAIERWCAETGIPFSPDRRNAGALRIFPRERTLLNSSIGTTLKEKGLRLTPEQEAWLRDPAEAERVRLETERLRKLEEARARAREAAQQVQRQRDEALWQAEMARLGVLESKKVKEAGDGKLRPPVILPPLELKFEEGYWKAELSRVAETDTRTLQNQKKTGLDKLAPPMKEEQPNTSPGQKPPPRTTPPRDSQAESDLFEAEMQRLTNTDSTQLRRAKRD